MHTYTQNKTAKFAHVLMLQTFLLHVVPPSLQQQEEVKKYLPCVVHRPHCIAKTGDVKVTLTAFDPIAGQSNASVEHAVCGPNVC